MIVRANVEERNWAARLFSVSEPWTTLGVTLDECLKFCTDPEYDVYIASNDNTLCGAMVVHPRGLASYPYLKSIVVPESFRGKGIGQTLIRFAEERYISISKHIFICVSSFNPRARKLYENLGYKRVGELNDILIEGESEILLYKRLR
jgi:ribosomal protein S18 acetylase RimI-like enzyme